MDKKRKIKRHFREADPTIATVVDAMKFEVLAGEKDHTRYFEKLCREIIAQQLGGGAARAILERFNARFPHRRATPKGVLALSEAQLRAIGMSWAKARYLRDLAERTDAGGLDLGGLLHMTDEEATRELIKVKGIGAWTAEMFLIFTLGREDVFSHGDLGLRKALEKLYGGRRTRTKESVERIVGRWSPYKSYGSLALWHTHDAAA